MYRSGNTGGMGVNRNPLPPRQQIYSQPSRGSAAPQMYSQTGQTQLPNPNSGIAKQQNPGIAQQQNQIASLQSILNSIQRAQQTQGAYQQIQQTPYPNQQSGLQAPGGGVTGDRTQLQQYASPTNDSQRTYDQRSAATGNPQTISSNYQGSSNSSYQSRNDGPQYGSSQTSAQQLEQQRYGRSDNLGTDSNMMYHSTNIDLQGTGNYKSNLPSQQSGYPRQDDSNQMRGAYQETVVRSSSGSSQSQTYWQQSQIIKSYGNEPYDPTHPNEDVRDDEDVAGVFKKQAVNLIKREQPGYVKINLKYQADASSVTAVDDESWKYCEICNIRFAEKKHYIVHCNGLLHSEKLNDFVKSKRSQGEEELYIREDFVKDCQPSHIQDSRTGENIRKSIEDQSFHTKRLTLDDISSGIWMHPGESGSEEKKLNIEEERTRATSDIHKEICEDKDKMTGRHSGSSHRVSPSPSKERIENKAERYSRSGTRYSRHERRRSRSRSRERRYSRDEKDPKSRHNRRDEEKKEENRLSKAKSSSNEAKTAREEPISNVGPVRSHSRSSDGIKSGHQAENQSSKTEKSQEETSHLQGQSRPEDQSKTDGRSQKKRLQYKYSQGSVTLISAPVENIPHERNLKPSIDDERKEETINAQSTSNVRVPEQNKESKIGDKTSSEQKEDSQTEPELSKVDEDALIMLESMFPHYKRDIIVTSVLDDENREGDFDLPLLIQRCIADLRTLRSFNKKKNKSVLPKNVTEPIQVSEDQKYVKEIEQGKKIIDRKMVTNNAGTNPDNCIVVASENIKKNHSQHQDDATTKVKPNVKQLSPVKGVGAKTIGHSLAGSDRLQLKTINPLSAKQDIPVTVTKSLNQQLPSLRKSYVEQPTSDTLQEAKSRVEQSTYISPYDLNVPEWIEMQKRELWKGEHSRGITNRDHVKNRASWKANQPMLRDPIDTEFPEKRSRISRWSKDSKHDPLLTPSSLVISDDKPTPSTSDKFPSMNTVPVVSVLKEESVSLAVGTSIQDAINLGAQGENKLKPKARRRNRPKFMSTCPFNGCNVMHNHIKNHAKLDHLPWFVFKDGPKRFELFKKYLRQIGYGLGADDLMTLLDLCLTKKWYPDEAKFGPTAKTPLIIAEVDEKSISNFYEGLCKKAPTKAHTIVPPNGIAALCHWRVLCCLINQLSETERVKLDMLYKSWETSEPPSEKEVIVLEDSDDEESDPIPSKRKKIERVVGIDTMVYLDVFKAKAGTTSFDSVLLRGLQPSIPFKLEHAICNYSYPDSFPDSRSRSRLREDRRLLFSYGVHPLSAHKTSTKELEDVVDLMQTKRVVALGRIGCDYSEPYLDKHKDAQHRVVQFLVSRFLNKKIPIIFHCKDKDIHTEVASEDCLHLAKTFLDANHPLVKHNFNGSVNDMRRWRENMPNTYFSFGTILLEDKKRKNTELDDVVIELPLDRILLESGSPRNLPPGVTAKYNTPNSITYVAEYIAKLKDISVELVFTETTKTARTVYQLN